MQLVKYDAARFALQEATTIDEIKDISDKVEALKAYARQRDDKDMEVWLSEIKLRADRKIGEISKGLEKSPGPGRGNKTMPTGGKSLKSQTLKDAGVSTSTANRCEQIAAIPEEEIEKVILESKENHVPISTKKILQKKTRAEKITTIQQGNQALPDKKYSVIYADPPWQYEFSKSDSRAIENQYPTMPIEDIKAMDIPAAKDSVLFLWTTSPKLDLAIDVIRCWGFVYKTCAVWDKQKIGMGYYFRQQHELLLVATRGNLPVPEPANRLKSVFSFKRGEHSSKPYEVYDMITTMYPDFVNNRIELFCRTPQVGWDVWGNQANG